MNKSPLAEILIALCHLEGTAKRVARKLRIDASMVTLLNQDKRPFKRDLVRRMMEAWPDLSDSIAGAWAETEVMEMEREQELKIREDELRLAAALEKEATRPVKPYKRKVQNAATQ